MLLWDVKESTLLFEKSRGRRPRWCGQPYALWDWVGMAPRMGPKSRSCTFPLGRPVSRKAGK